MSGTDILHNVLLGILDWNIVPFKMDEIIQLMLYTESVAVTEVNEEQSYVIKWEVEKSKFHRNILQQHSSAYSWRAYIRNEIRRLGATRGNKQKKWELQVVFKPSSFYS